MEYATRHLYFPYTHKPLGECVDEENTSDLSLVFSLVCILHTRLKACVYTENTSDAWHIPRYPTRKHCVTSMHAIAATACGMTSLEIIVCYVPEVELVSTSSVLRAFLHASVSN